MPRGSRSVGRRAAVLVAVALALAACDGAVVTTSGPAATPVATPTLTPSATPVPAATAEPGPTESPEPTLEAPPSVVLTGFGQSQAGDLGTYSWDGGSSGGPWLPGAGPIVIPTGASLSATVAPGPPVGEWRALYATYEGDGQAGTPSLLASGTGLPIAFPAPPAGSWSLLLEVAFPGRGNGAWYWAVEVPV